MIKKYIEKEPSKISAVLYTGDNFEEVDKFCTFHYSDKKGKEKEYHYAEIWSEEDKRVVLKGDMWCGDVAYPGDYVVAGDEYYHASPKEFEAEWDPTEKSHIFKCKKLTTIEAIQWKDDNTEEVLKFIDNKGGLEKSGKQILLMNNSGGSVAEKGSFVLKTQDNSYYAMTEELFLETFQPLTN